MIARVTMQMLTPRKNVRRNPSASVSDPTRSVAIVITSDQAETNPSAAWSFMPKSCVSQSTLV